MAHPELRISERVRRFGDLLYRRAIGEAEEMQSARSLCNRLTPIYTEGMRVLDVGCGAGHYLRSLRVRIDPSIDYTGVDANAHFIELARRAFPELDSLQIADAGKLPFADRAFDLVLCINVLPNLPPPPTRAMAELLRVSRRHVVIRTLFADTNYLIRELAPGEFAEHELIGPAGEIADEHLVHNNMYTEAFYRGVLGQVAAGWRVAIDRDDDWKPFDSRVDQDAWCTRAVAGQQVAGQLLLDWRYITLDAPARPAD